MDNPLKIAIDNGWELDYLTDGSPIFQCKKLYTFTSDSVRLSNYVDEKSICKLVDFCSGSGIVGLEVIGRIPTEELFQFELQPELAKMCEQTNFLNNEKTQITLYNESLINSPNRIGNVDVIVCNPPFFKMGSGKVNENNSLSLARHEVSITIAEIFECASKILKSGGSFYLVHIFERYKEIMSCAKKFGFRIEKEEVLESKKLQRFLVKLIKN